MPAAAEEGRAKEMRCVEVDLGPLPSEPQDLNRLVHRALCIQAAGLEWIYGETRPSDTHFRIAYYRYFESQAEFDEALQRLRMWLSGDEVVEVPCVSAHDSTMSIEE
jgi:hypothetical protein